ncbi:SDR family NAD(P)-dependent oxidoreductase [Microvirga puerhi]|uniref:SDR family oxidoreductase n=1 Tax=Microvirga puerhi TaxID=2876078 RepID=A0ABS7VWQ8_9HYPH|nr:SDR family oxidoreductase [Microvirga puerhi]MBZ6079298.1 SDR family oxidoreductase [Microvirga puerhi]
MSALSGRAIVITGAGSGLGAAYARHAASLGASVVVNDIDADKAEETAAAIRHAGGSALAHAGDVSRWETAQVLTNLCTTTFGALSGFVANAGILRHGRITDINERDLRRMFELNLLGTTACARAAAKAMLAQGAGGSIVTVTSGSQAGDVGLGGYGATKAAVAALTYSWAMELCGTGVRINAVSPLAETAMAARNKAHLADQQAKREIQYDVLPDPDVSAPVISYLLSDRSSDIHGQVVRIAGRQLSFVSHPMIADPILDGEWTFETVIEAFEKHLRHRQHKLGLSYAVHSGS